MSRAVCVSLTCLSAASLVAGCATEPVQTASDYAGQGANAIYRTGSDVYAGVGTAAKRPFQDLNMMQDPIPIVLLRAELDPYSVKGLTSCEVVMNRVAELDLALGPDLDAPADHPKSKVTEDAGLAAAAALEAAAAAAEGFMPVRSVVKRVSGASKYEAHVKHAILAGTERRTFLKAVGVMHSCSWPAAPLTLTADEARVVMIWGPGAGGAQLNTVVQTKLPVVAAAGSAASPGQVATAGAAAPGVQAPVAVGSAGGMQTASLAQPAAATAILAPPLVQTAALSSAQAAPPAGMSGASAPTPAQPVAQPVALVSSPTGASPSAPSAAYAPSPAYSGAPWTSPPPGGR